MIDFRVTNMEHQNICNKNVLFIYFLNLENTAEPR